MRTLTKEEKQFVKEKKESLTERGVEVVSTQDPSSSQEDKHILTVHPQVIRFDYQIPSESFAQ